MVNLSGVDLTYQKEIIMRELKIGEAVELTKEQAKELFKDYKLTLVEGQAAKNVDEWWGESDPMIVGRPKVSEGRIGFWDPVPYGLSMSSKQDWEEIQLGTTLVTFEELQSKK